MAAPASVSPDGGFGDSLAFLRLIVSGCRAFVFVASDALGGFLAFEEAGISQAFSCLAVPLGSALMRSAGDGIGLVDAVYDTSLFGDRDPGRTADWEGVDS